MGRPNGEVVPPPSLPPPWNKSEIEEEEGRVNGDPYRARETHNKERLCV